MTAKTTTRAASTNTTSVNATSVLEQAKAMLPAYSVDDAIRIVLWALRNLSKPEECERVLRAAGVARGIELKRERDPG